jgi:hypothetical protein
MLHTGDKMNTHEESQSYLGFVEDEIFKPLASTTKRDNLKVVCDTNRGEVVRELEDKVSRTMQDLAWAQGYLMARGAAGCGDSGHDEAVKDAEKRLKQVRKAMGFTMP